MKNITLETLKELIPYDTVNIYHLEAGWRIGELEDLMCEGDPMFVGGRFDVDHIAVTGENEITVYVK